MATLDIAIGPWAGGSLALLVRRVTQRIASLASITRRRRLGTVVFTHLLRHKSTALRLVQFNVPADLPRFKVTQDLSNCDKRERKIHLPVASFTSLMTSRMVLIDSLSRRTTAQSFSAMSASPSWGWAGRERFKRVNAWCSALNSVRDASDRPLSRSESIIDSMACLDRQTVRTL
eukprot:1101060-Pleurochrysis_carterae.AAC.3